MRRTLSFSFELSAGQEKEEWKGVAKRLVNERDDARRRWRVVDILGGGSFRRGREEDITHS
jgi:hypothetical protein